MHFNFFKIKHDPQRRAIRCCIYCAQCAAWCRRLQFWQFRYL